MHQRGLEHTPTDEPLNLTYSNLPPTSETYSAEWLPMVNMLSGDIRYLLEDQAIRKIRISTALEYVDDLRSRILPEHFSQQSEDYTQEQVTSRIFLDSIALLARQQIYHKGIHTKGRRSPETFDDLKMLLATKRDMQVNIASYVKLNPERPSDILLSNLLCTMNHARRLMYNDDVISEESRAQNARNLLGMLAENKVVAALQENQWPAANLSTVEQDSGGADVIVPINNQPGAEVVLQVKSHQMEGDFFQIHEEPPPPRVVVPMNTKVNDPFKLDPRDVATLNEFIYTAPVTSPLLAA